MQNGNYRLGLSATMSTVTDSQEEELRLTADQGYLAAYYFIRQFYERDGRKPESMFLLLSWMELEGRRMSSDPAQWEDWMHSIDVALERGGDGFSDPPPPPLSK
jgi:hypothetical protein